MTGDRDLLLQRIAESKLSRAEFAERVLARDERTVRRWLSGERPMPRVVARYLEELEFEDY